ncbi:putative Kazal domain-containing protein [Plasmopara halstedii]
MLIPGRFPARALRILKLSKKSRRLTWSSSELSVTFPFVAITVTSSCATASVVDNHHENAIGFHHNALPCTDVLCDDDYAPVCGFDNKTYPNACIFQATNCRTNVTKAYLGPCRNKFVDYEWILSSASATSLSEKMPLIRDRSHSANEERGSSIYLAEAIPLTAKSAFDSAKVRRVEKYLTSSGDIDGLLKKMYIPTSTSSCCMTISPPGIGSFMELSSSW